MITAKEIHEACHDAMLQCPQFDGWDDDTSIIGWVAFNLESNCYMWSYIYFDSKGRDLGWGSKYELRPIYSHPPRPEPARKPMTEEEINEEFLGNKKHEQTGDALSHFFKGIRFAEKHHGIGGDDE
jgi:hypothetical protein